MTTDPNEVSPSYSPLAAGIATDFPRRRFPWRIVPVVLLYLYGGLAAVSSTWFVCISLWGCMLTLDPQHPHHVYDMSESQRCFMALGMVFFGIHGCFAIAVGRYLWKQLWRRSVVAIAGAIILVVLMYVVLGFVHRVPPGRQLTCPAKPSRTRRLIGFVFGQETPHIINLHLFGRHSDSQIARVGQLYS